jgi:ATPase subunit of ABC transporter with duplicated ATPase domains
VSSIVVADLEYAPPGADSLFFDVSFGVAPGEHAAMVGPNGVGKSTILRILAGELTPDAGSFQVGGTVLTMPQDAGLSRPTDTVRDLLLCVAAPALRNAGEALVAAEHTLATGADDGTAYAAALTAWGDLGGYELEAQWSAAVRRAVKSEVDDVTTRRVGDLSGGERKRLLLELLLSSDADVLLLDEPDNYLDIPTRGWLEERLAGTKTTVLMVSHDRTLLSRAATKVIAVEGSGAWVHGGSYATFPAARRRRQEQLGDALTRWKDEERRLHRHMRTMKQRAAMNDSNASRANAAETRWRKFVDAGPPPPPVRDEAIKVRLHGGDSARRVVRIVELSVADLFLPFSDDVYFGERVGLIGPNGTGKTHLMRALAGHVAPGEGSITFGPRTSVGLFTQVNDRPDFAGRQPIEIVKRLVHDDERAMKALARYGLADHARQRYETLSGGQRARLEILGLELEGHNVLLLDEPTDNLDIESSEALERALDAFQGTIIAVSHDRTFLATLDRFLLVDDDGEVWSLPDFDVAMQALGHPAGVPHLRLARRLT